MLWGIPGVQRFDRELATRQATAHPGRAHGSSRCFASIKATTAKGELRAVTNTWNDRWKSWNRYKYLSDFERSLNRTLWGLLWIAVVGAITQHVLLANVPEVFRSGARWGDVLYDLAIAYTVAFTFYLLVVRAPLRRDRANVYEYLGSLIFRIAREATHLVYDLNRAAGVDGRRDTTLENITDICRRLRPEGRTRQQLTEFGEGRTVWELVSLHLNRARAVHREILNFTSFLASDVVKMVAAIDNCRLYREVDGLSPRYYEMYMAGCET